MKGIPDDIFLTSISRMAMGPMTAVWGLFHHEKIKCTGI
jgi:hypothetical protein